ncbi:MAG: hypothetical protein K0B15_02515 [Lentimicrobium sp.]|nr:hypothetical protein [Lentimicrobium sp.]
MSLTQNIYAHGKLLLTGEYLVLKGAQSLALPLILGQKMTISAIAPVRLEWQARDINGVWYRGFYNLPGLEPITVSDEMVSRRLVSLLEAARKLNPDFLNGESGFKIETILEFDRRWGFGSSSTLIALVAEFANVDAFRLHNLVSNGSGYDIACAIAANPIIFSQKENNSSFREVSFFPEFSDSLYFVYLGNKQSSTAEVESFLMRSPEELSDEINEISVITSQMISVQNQNNFNSLIQRHEQLMSKVLNVPSVAEKLFADFQGVVKSLGAWGGDFILVSSVLDSDYVNNYFFGKGLTTIFRYKDLVLNSKGKNSI